jgi:hypothetical protein
MIINSTNFKLKIYWKYDSRCKINGSGWLWTHFSVRKGANLPRVLLFCSPYNLYSALHPNPGLLKLLSGLWAKVLKSIWSVNIQIWFDPSTFKSDLIRQHSNLIWFDFFKKINWLWPDPISSESSNWPDWLPSL